MFYNVGKPPNAKFDVNCLGNFRRNSTTILYWFTQIVLKPRVSLSKILKYFNFLNGRGTNEPIVYKALLFR